MHPLQINRLTGKVILILSVVAFATVLSGYLQSPQPDEGTGAHIFQLSILALVPMILLFVATADWEAGLAQHAALAGPGRRRGSGVCGAVLPGALLLGRAALIGLARG